MVLVLLLRKRYQVEKDWVTLIFKLASCKLQYTVLRVITWQLTRQAHAIACVATSNIETSDVATSDVETSDVATGDVATSDVKTQLCC